MTLTKTNSRNLSNLEINTSSDDKKKRAECIIDVTDSQGKTNLCCCYVVDDDGRYTSPCYMPVHDCC